MNIINEKYNIPYYIFEEITEYIELIAKGQCKWMKWKKYKIIIKSNGS